MKNIFSFILNKIQLGLIIAFQRKNPAKISQKYRLKGMEIGEGTLIYPNVVLGRGGKDPITIGKNCVLTGCAVIAHDASTNRELGINLSMQQRVVIEDDCFIGLGAIVLMGVRIGKGSIVGSGAVVTADVPPGSVVAGNPARVISTVQDLVNKRLVLAESHPDFFPTKPRARLTKEQRSSE